LIFAAQNYASEALAVMRWHDS